MLSRLELRVDKSIGVIALTLWAGIMCFMTYSMRNELFKWDNPGGYDTIIFLMVLTFGVLAIISMFDKRPEVIIEQEGIWKRKYFLPFSPMILVNWNEMQYFFLLQKSDKNGTSFNLVIRYKETEKDVKVGLTSLDSSPEDILSLVRQYAAKHGIHDLGEEIG